jgi:glycosyltransferase involved in cell wall biosynthesis
MVAPQPFFEPRGTPLSVYYRALVLAELGVRVDLLCYGQGVDVDVPGVRILRIPRFRLLGRVGVGPSPLKALLDVPLALRAYQRLLATRYDFVHVHEEAIFLCWPLLFLGPKLVYDMHSSLPRQLVAYRWNRIPLLVPLVRWLERLALRRVDALLTISPGLAEYALTLVSDPGRHLLIENSIFDPPRTAGHIDRKQDATWLEHLPEGRSIVAYAGTFEPYQALDLLVESVAIARRQLPDLFLLMIGGEASQIEELEALTRRVGLAGHALFTGFLDFGSTASLLERADILVSPRRAGSNTPLKIYQMMASGKPVVATRIAPHTEVLDDSTAFLADPVPESFAAGLLAAATELEEARRRAAAAQERYESRYSPASYKRKMQDLLDLLEP